MKLIKRKLELLQVNNAGISGAIMDWDALKASGAGAGGVSL